MRAGYQPWWDASWMETWLRLARAAALLFAITAQGAAYYVSPNGVSMVGGSTIRTVSANFNGVDDYVLAWGFNLGPDGQRADPNSPKFNHQLEYDFFSGGMHWMEYNFDFQGATNGINRRFSMFKANRYDPDSFSDWAFNVSGGGNFHIATKCDIETPGRDLLIARPSDFTVSIPGRLIVGTNLQVVGRADFNYVVLPNNGGIYVRNPNNNGDLALISNLKWTTVISPNSQDTVCYGNMRFRGTVDAAGPVSSVNGFKSGSTPGITTTWTNMISGVITQRLRSVGGIMVENTTL